MYMFAGKFSHETKSYADNELWTIFFPDGFETGDIAIVLCQWTKKADGRPKVNEKWTGIITKAEGSGEIQLEIFKDDPTLYYWFKGTVSASKDRIDLTMWNPRHEYCGVAKAEVFS